MAFDGVHVTFRWRDYAHGNKSREMTLSAEEFIRRFQLHVLPKGFVRIRNFGILANCHRAALVPLCRHVLGMTPLEMGGDSSDSAQPCSQATWSCPVCHGTMVTVERLSPARRLPVHILRYFVAPDTTCANDAWPRVFGEVCPAHPWRMTRTARCSPQAAFLTSRSRQSQRWRQMIASSSPLQARFYACWQYQKQHQTP